MMLLPCLFALFLAADEPVFSGPQPGEKLTPFKVLGHSGPNAGKEVQLLADSKGGPTLLIFVHELTRPGRQLLLPLEAYSGQLAKDGFATHFIWLTADKTKTEEFLTRAKASLNFKAPISISLDGLEGPGSYGLNRKVSLTILVAKDNKVVANFAIVQPNETDAPKILAAMAKLVGKQPPKLEELGVAKRPADTAKTDRDPALAQLMRRMIQKTNDEDTVREIAREMVKWAGEDAKKKAQLKEYCQQIVKLGYGTDAAKKALQRLAGE